MVVEQSLDPGSVAFFGIRQREFDGVIAQSRYFLDAESQPIANDDEGCGQRMFWRNRQADSLHVRIASCGPWSIPHPRTMHALILYAPELALPIVQVDAGTRTATSGW